MNILWLDSETYSSVPIGNGVRNYCAASDFQVLLLSYAINDAPPKLWRVAEGMSMPRDLADAISDVSMVLAAHNTAFDRYVFHKADLFATPLSLTKRHWLDTMVQAQCHGLPGKLNVLSELFGLSDEEGKLKSGHQLIHLFCKPDKEGNRADWKTHPDQWQEFCRYAVRDITSMRVIHKKLPKWNYPGKNFPKEISWEYSNWVTDQQMNGRGFAVDTELAEAALNAYKAETKALNKKAQDMTEGDVEAATQRDKLLKHIFEAYGISLPNMQADTLRRRINDPHIPEDLRQLLLVRVDSSRNNSSKYRSVIRLQHNGRIYGGTQFCGAQATGRWSGRGFQGQNMMRPTMSPDEINQAIEAVKAGAVDLIYPNVSEVLGNCVRGCIVAPEGKKLAVADLSSIEGRMLAWLSGEDKVLDFYRSYDAGLVNYDSYMLAYTLVFGGDPEAVTKDERTIGKPIELATGYGGGAGAFVTFARVYGLDLKELAARIWDIGDSNQLAVSNDKYEWAKERKFHAGLPQQQYAAFDYVVQKWRANRPKTVKFWTDLEDAFRAATMYKGETFRVGPVAFNRTGQWLRLRLPSGRCLNFVQPKVTSSGLSYMGMDPYTHKWGRVHTYGGKLAGWVTQASASCHLRHCMDRAERAGYKTVLTIHDELITEVPDTDKYSAEGLCRLMTQQTTWAPDLPLAASGFEAYRYRKD